MDEDQGFVECERCGCVFPPDDITEGLCGECYAELFGEEETT